MHEWSMWVGMLRARSETEIKKRGNGANRYRAKHGQRKMRNATWGFLPKRTTAVNAILERLEKHLRNACE
jgi:hypothetical protein